MRVIALVTLFHPKQDHALHIAEYARQCDLVFLCDNSGTDSSSLFSDIKNCLHIRNPDNLGLSRAFNIALSPKCFAWQDEDYVLFFDQDSEIAPNHVRSLIDEYKKIVTTGVAVGALGPVFFNSSTGRTDIPRLREVITPETFSCDALITSSMLTTYSNLKRVSFWNEGIFLDYADWDLCWRLRSSGLSILMTNAVVLRHASGIGEQHVCGLRVLDEIPVRRYYQVRDLLKLLQKFYMPRRWRHALGFVKKLVLQTILLDRRSLRLYYTYLGVRDFFQRINGKLEEKNDNPVGKKALPL